MKVGHIGNALVRLIKAKDLIDIGLELGKKFPDFALCDNPNCEDCVRQRAEIFEARIRNIDNIFMNNNPHAPLIKSPISRIKSKVRNHEQKNYFFHNKRPLQKQNPLNLPLKLKYRNRPILN